MMSITKYMLKNDMERPREFRKNKKLITVTLLSKEEREKDGIHVVLVFASKKALCIYLRISKKG